MPTTRLMLADDHPIVRAGLKEVLAAESDREVVGEATNGGALLAVLASGR